MRHLNCVVLVVVVLAMLLCVQPAESSRLLSDQDMRLKKRGIFLHALQRGPVPPSGPSGCTNIPGGGGSGCPIREMHLAGGGTQP
ncbi:uncharacterized protein LOC111373200 [Olea europaea var. sylvestris]|uniref:uncharacterized protein LOC111373200 n=1 Tax=Olea europaea var. sylvestris TaxID=158386 RepID=UPI000C1D6315|nr:uncharacterized protein LOC111373200 [Olea europaea var. sylvestris]